MTSVTSSLSSPLASTTPAAAPLALRDAWEKARAEQAMARPFDVAANLGVSEVELVAARAGDPNDVIRLRPDWDLLLPELGRLGEVMALTRNPHAVIEKNGRWTPYERTGPVAIVHDDGIDLRLFMNTWQHVYAVLTTTPDGLRRSLQFFDGAGLALHKIFVKEGAPEASATAFDALVAQLRDPDQSPGVTVTATAPPAAEKLDADIDIASFQAAWRGLTDTHEFFGMLRKFNVQRHQAMRLAPPELTREVAVSSARTVLEQAAESSLPIMVFVGNRGCLEIHSGRIKRVKVMGPWLNILDKGFNLHLREDRIVSAWVVTKPTNDGPVTSLELYDSDHQNIAIFFGSRQPGQAEEPAWQALAASLA